MKGLILLFTLITLNSAFTQTLSEKEARILNNLPSSCEGPDKTPIPKSIAEVHGQHLEGNPEKYRFIIDGPANLRDAPKGKVIDSFNHELVVYAEGKAVDWYLVRGYWDNECQSGWTYKSNLKPYSKKPKNL